MYLTPLILLLGVVCASTTSAAPPTDPMDPVNPTEFHVSRATTCRGVADREAVDPTAEFQLSDERVYLWCEVMNGADTTVTHVYSHDGVEITRVELSVRSDRFRTWSYKRLHPGNAGDWHAEILAEDGTVLYATDFSVADDGT